MNNHFPSLTTNFKLKKPDIEYKNWMFKLKKKIFTINIKKLNKSINTNLITYFRDDFD